MAKKAPWRKGVDARRRQLWNEKCEFCGFRWHNAKTNVVQEESGVCVQCHTAVCKAIARGAAWIMKRRSTLNFWDDRLVATGVSARKSRKKAS